MIYEINGSNYLRVGNHYKKIKIDRELDGSPKIVVLRDKVEVKNGDNYPQRTIEQISKLNNMHKMDNKPE